MLRDFDPFALLGAKGLHGRFENQVLSDEVVEDDLRARVVVSVEVLFERIVLVGLLAPRLDGSEERGDIEAQVERHIFKAPRTLGKHVGIDAALDKHIDSASLGVHLQLAGRHPNVCVQVGIVQRGFEPTG